ncbi:MAG: twin-arginine translocase TatA/TatE family subunit [Chloroflexota bacterium]
MPTLGAPELIIILVIIILIFGVGKLPEVGQALGKGIREFRGAADANDDEPAATPAKPAAPAAPVAVEAPRPAAAPAPAVEAPRQPVTVPVAAPATVAYTVNTGDTPDTVATSHGVTVDELLAANGWSQRDRVLYAGDKIQIPVKPA